MLNLNEYTFLKFQYSCFLCNRQIAVSNRLSPWTSSLWFSLPLGGFQQVVKHVTLLDSLNVSGQVLSDTFWIKEVFFIHQQIKVVVLRAQGPISWTDLSLASYHFVLDLSPQTELSLSLKLVPYTQGDFSLWIAILIAIWRCFLFLCRLVFVGPIHII